MEAYVLVKISAQTEHCGYARSIVEKLMMKGVENVQFALAEDAVASMQNVFQYDWIPSFNIYYFMGVDGISFPLVVLTAFISVLAMVASWSITAWQAGSISAARSRHHAGVWRRNGSGTHPPPVSG